MTEIDDGSAPADAEPDTFPANRLAAALDAISEAFVIYGPDGRLVLCNRSFREIYGYSEQEARPGVHFQELGRLDVERGNVVVGDEYGGGEAYLARKAEYRRRLEGSFTVRLRDGRWLKTTDRRMPDGGFVSVQADVTELKQAEASLALAKQEAERSNRAKSEFLARMSHELRTPLNSILGYSEILATADWSGAEPAKVNEYARTIHRAGSILLDLINDILDLSKVEAGKIVLADDLVDLAGELDACIEMLAPRAAEGGLTLHRLPGGAARETGALLEGDQRAIRQILMNLLSNAVKFTPSGRSVAAAASLGEDRRWRLVVRDEGVGIESSDLERIFEPFEQSREGYLTAGSGTGLGLTITRALVELHGGALAIDSAPGKGATVTVTFPAARTRPLESA